MAGQPMPASGAWRAGDPVGHRQFLDFTRPFALDGGVTLDEVTVAYETWGQLDDSHSNAILLCHAWTGDSHAVGPMGHGHPSRRMVGGRGRARHGDRHRSLVRRVRQRARRLPGIDRPGVAASRRRQAVRQPVPGGHRSATWCARRLAWPTTSAIHVWHSVIGGSMGGMQVLEWAITFPHRVRSIVPIATCAQATAQQIAWGAIGRRAIRIDPNWRGGDYYDADDDDGPWEGLSVARMVAQVTFRSDNVFTDRFGRELADGATLRDTLGPVAAVRGRALPRPPRREAGPPLRRQQLPDHRQGDGPARRRPRPRRTGAGDGRIQVPTLTIGISSDILYPSYQQRQIRDLLLAGGTPCEYVEIDSPHGHDAFLINLDQLSAPLGEFVESVAKL